MLLSKTQILILRGKVCPYCLNASKLISASEIYGPAFSHKQVWACLPCHAWVGCHKGARKALGRLANHELRAAKKRAHVYFDQIWQKGHLDRTSAYKWLSQMLGLPSEYTHIGCFNVDTCNEVVRLSKMVIADYNYASQTINIHLQNSPL
jgi:hypothetical protein